jgi:ATP-dependent RNA helicase RhlE
MKFTDLTAAPALIQAIQENGWTVPTPIQTKAILPAREGRDVVGIAQTGTGKTAAFLLPAIEKHLDIDVLHTLILCPTRELAQQVAADGRLLTKHTKMKVCEVVGGMPMRAQNKDLAAGCNILVATPGRLFDHVERGTVKLDHVKMLVLDEADRMLDMGFRPQIEAILDRLPAQRQTLLFSATMPRGVHALAMRITNEAIWVEASPEFSAAVTVEQSVYSVRTDRKPALLVDLLQQTHWEQVLVFCARKTGADTLLTRLTAAGIKADVLHGDKDMKQRRRALDEFANGNVQVLVATDVAQRGLDIEGISHVVNYDVPRNPEDYVHRIGRTGRAGAEGTAVTFMSGGELAAVADIERVIGFKLPRISRPEFDYEGGVPSESAKENAPRSNRSGSRLGSRSASELTPEELQELLKVG